jgi:hypothetical protein
LVACSKDGGTLLAATAQGPILSSLNAGTAWTAANTPYGNWSALVISENGNWGAASSGDTIYAAPALPLVFVQKSYIGINLSWACSLTNFSLQENDFLDSTNWTDYSETVSVVGGLNNVWATTSNTSSFFRLKAP